MPKEPSSEQKNAEMRAKRLKLQTLDDQVTKAREAGLKIVRGLNMESGGLGLGLGGIEDQGEVERPTGVADVDTLFAQFKSEAQAGTADLGRLADMLEQAADVYEKRNYDIKLDPDKAAARAFAFRNVSKQIKKAMDARDEAETLRIDIKGQAGPTVYAQKADIAKQNQDRVIALQKSIADVRVSGFDRERMRKELEQLQQQPAEVPKPAEVPQGPDISGPDESGLKQTSIDPISALKHATGDESETLDFASNIFKRAQESGKFNLDDPDNIAIGARKLVEGTGQEGMAKFYSDHQAMYATIGGPAGAIGQASVATDKARPENQAQMRVEQDETNLRQSMRELRDSDPMSTTGGVLLYVVMSMLLGPRIATLILNNRNKQGKLADDVEMWKYKLRQHQAERQAMMDREQRRQDDTMRYRQQAAMEDRRQQHRMDIEAVRAVTRYRELKQKDPGDERYKKLMDVYRDHMGRYDKLKGKADFYQQRMDQANADLYMASADAELRKAFAVGDMAEEIIAQSLEK